MKIPIIMVLAASPLVLCGPRKHDCTDTFKNRVAAFEYNYYPGYWITPSMSIGWANTLEVKTNKKFQWILHDCGDSVCMESKEPGFKDYFAGLAWRDRRIGWDSGYVGSMYLETDLSDGSNEKIHWRILCDSCNPGDSENTTFNHCQMNNIWDWKLYSSRKGGLWFCPDCGDDSWFRWRIESPPTRVYWEVVHSHCNEENKNVTMKCAMKSSITTSTSTTSTVSVNAKITMGLGAGKLLQSAISRIGELGASFTWSRTYMEQLAREKTMEISSQVEPGMRWVVSQAVGEAGWTSISTDRTKSEQIPCWSTTTTRSTT